MSVDSHEAVRQDKKKPGRKPNPASPALRKAQNRAAQRAFRERKERHIIELEIARKQLSEQCDQLQAENEHLRKSVTTLGHESWHLKGALLTMQLICLVHRIAIPTHSPFMRQETLTKLAQDYPEVVASYLTIKDTHGLPPSGLSESSTPHLPAKDLQVSANTIVVAKDGIHALPSGKTNPQPSLASGMPRPYPVDPPAHSTPSQGLAARESTETPETITLSPVKTEHAQEQDKLPANKEVPSSPNFSPQPIMLTKEPFPAYNLQAFQIVRLRSHLQKCIEMGSSAFVIEPTILQLTIPHDPRVDYIPMATMRDRMILFRNHFDLDECVQCILEGSVYKDGDPTLPDSWVLPNEFYERYWFLSVSYDQLTSLDRWPLSALRRDSAFTSTMPASLMALDTESSKLSFPLPNLACLLPRQDQSMSLPDGDTSFLDMSMLSSGLPGNHYTPSLSSDGQPSAGSPEHSTSTLSDMEDVGSLVFSPEHQTGNCDENEAHHMDTLMDDYLFSPA